MNKSHWLQVAAATAAIGVLLGTTLPGSVLPRSGEVSVGDEVSYQFRSPVLNGMGMDELADLRGKPVLVEFWGTK